MKVEDAAHDQVVSALLDDLASCTRQLETLCAALRPTGTQGGGDNDCTSGVVDELLDREHKQQSADAIATECLQLLATLQVKDVETNDDASSRSRELENEIDSLAEEFEALAQRLHDNSGGDIASLSDSSANAFSNTDIPQQEKENEPTTFEKNRAMETLAQSVKRRLTLSGAQRQRTRRPSFAYREQYPLVPARISPQPKRAIASSKNTSLNRSVRKVLASPEYWRQYQTKSFQRHITRQRQARELDAQTRIEREKAIEYRYRRASTIPRSVASSSGPVALPKSLYQTYLARFSLGRGGVVRRRPVIQSETTTTAESSVDCDVLNGITLGIYPYTRRSSRHVVYLTCSSLDDLKQKIEKHLPPTRHIVNLYREHTTCDARKKRTRRLQRIERFELLRHGDILCVTIDAYEDMAILCERMRQNQESKTYVLPSHRPPKASRPTENASSSEPPRTQQTKVKPYEKYATPAEKLWDENGRCIAVREAIPL